MKYFLIIKKGVTKEQRSEKEKKRNEFCGEFKKDADGIRRKCEGGSRKISVGV